MRAFVTGGSGFVGRTLVGELVARGDVVRALARSAGAAEAVRATGAEACTGDLDDVAALRAGMAGCEVVFHAAAHVDFWGPAEVAHRVNVVGTENVIAAARAAGVRRLVHVSTEAVLLGGRPIVRADESWPRPARPLGIYPRTKGQAEARVEAASDARLETVIARPRFVWGRGDTSVLPHLMEAVRAGRFAWIGGGHHLTSTCHVRNVCEGLLLCAEARPAGGIYFFTDGPPVELRAFVGALLRAAGVEPGDRSVPRWLAFGSAAVVERAWGVLGGSRPPPVTASAAHLIGEEVTVDDGRARRELGYVGRVTREAGLAELASSPR